VKGLKNYHTNILALFVKSNQLSILYQMHKKKKDTTQQFIKKYTNNSEANNNSPEQNQLN